MEIIEFLSLQNFDSYWRNALEQSNFLAFIKKLFAGFSEQLHKWPQAKTLGLWLQTLSFYLSLLLFACLPLPQFAKDKEGLAGIVIVAFIVWLGGIFLAGRPKRNGNAIDALIILFFAINLVSTFSSHYFSYSIHGLLKLLVYILAYFLLSSQLIGRPRRQIALIAVLLLTGTLVSLYGLYQFKIGVEPLATWEDPSLENQTTRIYATFNNPNLLAGYLLPLAMLAGSLAFTTIYKRKFVLALITSLITGLLLVAITLTGSRGAYIGTAAGFLGFLSIVGTIAWRQSQGKRWLLLCLAGLGLVIAVFVLHRFPGYEQRILSIFAGREHSSNSFRLNVWHSCLSMFKDNWLTGIGVGNQTFRLAYGLYMRSGFDALAAYSVPLEVGVEAGIAALLCFALIILSTLCRAHIFFWNKAVTVFRQNQFSAGEKKQNGQKDGAKFWLDPDSTSEAIAAGAALALIALFFHGLVDTVFFRPQVQFIFFLMLVMLAGLDGFNQPASQDKIIKT